MKILASSTRMELLKLKRRHLMAERGHKLLKDKLDGLSQEFLRLLREEKILREKIENILPRIFTQMVMVYGLLGPKVLSETLSLPGQKISLKVKRRNIMGVNLPVFEAQGEGELYPYLTSLELDQVIFNLNSLMPELIKLAELRCGIERLGFEMERTRRRVNALEYIFIPDLEETVKFISQKLSEMGRSSLVSLIKIKEFLTLQR